MKLAFIFLIGLVAGCSKPTCNLEYIEDPHRWKEYPECVNPVIQTLTG
jgi:hypothetical protein